MGSRVKTPTILQMEATECGAAALGIILAYYKRYLSLEELRAACAVSRDGSNALNMLKAARLLGLKAQGAQAETEGLYEAKPPFIVFWKFNHFVVVEDLKQDIVYINDPATGRREISIKEFNKSFTGVLILIEPGPDFKPGGHPPSVFRSLRKRLLSSLKPIVFIILMSLGLIVPGIMIPGFSKIFIDDILLAGTKSWLVLLLLGFGLTAILRSFFGAIQSYCLLRLHMKLMITGSVELLWHVFRLPLVFFEQRFMGDIANRLGATERVANILADNVSASVVSLISMIFYGAVMFIYDWRLTLIGLTTAIANACVLLYTSRKLTDTSRKYLQDQGLLAGISMNGLRSIETLKASVLDSVFFKEWSHNHAKVLQGQQKLMILHQILSKIPSLMTGLSTVLILGIGSSRIIEGFLTVGTLVAFQSLLASFNAPLNTLLGIGAKIQEIPGDISRIEDVLHNKVDERYLIKPARIPSDRDLTPSDSDRIPTSHPARRRGIQNDTDTNDSLVLKDIVFGYTQFQPPLLQNFNLTLKKGGQIALVGATGSGKSTLAKLMCGLHKPWSGDITISGRLLSMLSPEELANNLAFVDQDILLFEGLVRDNLSLWNDKIPNNNLEIAALDACIYDVLLTRKLFDTFVEENGKNFSGGERQRLEIARALVRQPKVLVLDEGTSALDSIIEEKIIQNLRARGYSLLLITHRLSAIRDSDEIIVLDQGVVVERGTHEGLIASNGQYATLFNSGA